MSNAQREALERHIPTTEVIRDAVTFPRDRLGEPLDISAERFDKWLADIKANAWGQGHAASDRDWEFCYDIVTPDEDRVPLSNPYREGRV